MRERERTSAPRDEEGRGKVKGTTAGCGLRAAGCESGLPRSINSTRSTVYGGVPLHRAQCAQTTPKSQARSTPIESLHTCVVCAVRRSAFPSPCSRVAKMYSDRMQSSMPRATPCLRAELSTHILWIPQQALTAAWLRLLRHSTSAIGGAVRVGAANDAAGAGVTGVGCGAAAAAPAPGVAAAAAAGISL